ncbi:MAG TPA: guanylate kinase [Nitrospiria bacterium]|nr:guanylate kinase [Nitrospiria bacterium]
MTRHGRKGLLYVVSAPSGAGKTSLCQEVTKIVPNLEHSVSFTTRPPRSGEVHGKNYYFVDEETFRQKVDRNEFMEWAEVHGNLYGTPRDLLMEKLDKGIDVILDIDAQGAMQLKKNNNNKEGVYIYILPPSPEVLRTRLMERKSDSPEEIARRLKKAREEVWNYRQYYYLIVNDNFKEALKKLEAIIIAERTKMRQVDYQWIEETFIKQ